MQAATDDQVGGTRRDCGLIEASCSNQIVGDGAREASAGQPAFFPRECPTRVMAAGTRCVARVIADRSTSLGIGDDDDLAVKSAVGRC